MTTLTRPTTGAQPQSGRTAFRTLVPTLVRDIGVPTAAYYLLHWNGASDWSALLAGAVLSGAMLVLEAIRARKLEVFSGFMLGWHLGMAPGHCCTGVDPRRPRQVCSSAAAE